jgi:regulator of protease activity HflC (stomatin/prohibitin superfamily)
VITKDGVDLKVNAVIYLRVVDPKKAELYVEQDYRYAVEEYVKGRIRNIIGSMDLQMVYGDITKINERLKEEARRISQGWGVEVEDVELQNVEPSPDVAAALKARQIAEMQRRASEEQAAATKIRIDAIKDATKDLDEQTLAFLYIKSLEQIAKGPANKIIFPLEFSKLAQRLAGEKK